MPAPQQQQVLCHISMPCQCLHLPSHVPLHPGYALGSNPLSALCLHILCAMLMTCSSGVFGKTCPWHSPDVKRTCLFSGSVVAGTSAAVGTSQQHPAAAGESFTHVAASARVQLHDVLHQGCWSTGLRTFMQNIKVLHDMVTLGWCL